MKPLRVYVSASCLVCDRARQLVDLDQPDAVKPDFVFGTPTYVLGERIVFLGNPALATLLSLLDAEAPGAVNAAPRRDSSRPAGAGSPWPHWKEQEHQA
jgi:hypothetical protein